jgi:hypothetical protein
MRKFLRRSLTFISLLCLVAMVVLWVRSRATVDGLYVYCRHFDGARGWLSVSIGSVGNTFVAASDSVNDSLHVSEPAPPPSERTPLRAEFLVVSQRRDPGDAEFAGSRWWNRLGFCCAQNIHRDDRWVGSRLWVGVPHWFLLSFFAVIPLMSLRRAWTRRQRARKRLCVNCGYDLRASPERCPECGETPERGMGNLPMHLAAKQHA